MLRCSLDVAERGFDPGNGTQSPAIGPAAGKPYGQWARAGVVTYRLSEGSLLRPARPNCSGADSLGGRARATFSLACSAMAIIIKLEKDRFSTRIAADQAVGRAFALLSQDLRLRCKTTVCHPPCVPLRVEARASVSEGRPAFAGVLMWENGR
jgi:hypothetical protein